jgi:hypothetical protein
MLPTFRRIKNGRLPRLLESVLNTTLNLKAVKLCLCINDHDTETLEYVECEMRPSYPIEFDVVLEHSIQPNLSAYFNEMYDRTQFREDSTMVSMIGDDMVFVTQGWEQAVLTEINKHNGIGIVWCDDDYIAHENLCVNLFTTRETVRRTRKPFMCPLFHADMIDIVWMHVGQMTGIGHYLENVVVRHEHSTRDSGDKWDETFQRLAPVQNVANGPKNHKVAKTYAAICAHNLVQSGACRWMEGACLS